MPLTAAMPGFALTKQQRIIAVIEGAGGPVRAAQITGLSRTTLRNWRQEGADPPMGAISPLCREAGVSLDWVETGYQVRPDIAALSFGPGVSETGAATVDLAGYARLLPLKPDVAVQAGQRVERWTPSPFAVGVQWLYEEFELAPDTARYAVIDEAGMAPLIPVGAAVILDTRPGPKRRSGMYLVEAGEELLPRRLNRLPKGEFELVADNSSWRYNLGADDDPVMWRIVWAARAT